jgi:hypothetical protein
MSTNDDKLGMTEFVRRLPRRACGTCSLCCKLPSVLEIDKHIDEWCKHCRPGKGGCTIYEQRPQACKKFTCGWLEGKLGDEWFPAKCKMYVTAGPPNERFRVIVDPAFPDAWRREPHYSQLKAIAPILIRVGRRFIKLHADGTEREVVHSRAYIEGRSEEEVER